MKIGAVLFSSSLLFIAGCSSGTTTSPSVVIQTPVVGPPAQISLNIVPGVGASSTQAFISATVTDARGAGVKGTTVTFSTTAGTLNPPNAITDGGGLAQTTLTAVTAATITAATGSVTVSAPAAIHADLSVSYSVGTALRNQPTSFSMSAIGGTAPMTYRIDFGDGFFDQATSGQATHFYAQSATYPITVRVTDAAGRTGASSGMLIVTDPPSAPVTPTPPPVPTPPPTLTATLTCTPPSTHPNPTSCNVTVAYGGVTIPSANVTNVSWDWGDGFFDATSGPTNQRSYPVGGSFTVFATVTATTVDGSKTASPVSKAIVVP